MGKEGTRTAVHLEDEDRKGLTTGFTPPGPGHWELDRSHFPGGTTPIIKWLLPVAVESAYLEQWPILGIPAVVGAPDAMKVIADGDRVENDPIHGAVSLVLP